MKILFVVDRIYNKSDPNINLIKNMVPYLERENEVFFLGHDIKDENKNDFCFIYKKDEKIGQLYALLNQASLFKKIIKILANFKLFSLGLLKILNIDLIVIEYKKHIKECVEKYNIDAVISVSAPFYTAKAISQSDVKCKKIIYMFDPYSDHHLYKKNRIKKQERKAIRKVDKVIVPKLLEENFKQRYEKKSMALEFPALLFNKADKDENPFKKDKVNIAYIGSLYADIRNPDYLYTLFNKIDNHDIELTMVGGQYGEFSKEFYNKHKHFIKEKVNLVGKIPKKDVMKYISYADVLVNIGNRVENMMPSKVVELMATGKPILNITQINNCPSLAYFEKYPLVMNVKENDFSKQTISEINLFCKKNKGIQIDFSKIEEEFVFATPKFVSNELEKMLKEEMYK